MLLTTIYYNKSHEFGTLAFLKNNNIQRLKFWVWKIINFHKSRENSINDTSESITQLQESLFCLFCPYFEQSIFKADPKSHVIYL